MFITYPPGYLAIVTDTGTTPGVNVPMLVLHGTEDERA